jgi:multiple sugar transport system permease protein
MEASAVSEIVVTSNAQVKNRRMRINLENETTLGYLLLTPTLAILIGLLGYPLLLAIYFSLTDKLLARAEINFIGLENYIVLLQDPVFLRTLVNTFNYTLTAVVFKLILGLIMALTLNEAMRFRRFFRGAFLLPWVVPSSLSVLAWLWIFDSQFSVLTFVLQALGIVDERVAWLGSPGLAMASVQTVNIWRGTPFFGLALLAALVTVPKELYEAAIIDGASSWQRFWAVTFPWISPTLVVVTLFSFVQTMGDFQVVWILTHGGPINSTHLLSTLAFQTAIQGANLGKGSAIAIFLFPVLLLVIIFQLRYLNRED